MEKLWKKGIYEDIFVYPIYVAEIDNCIQYAGTMELKKNNRISTELRVLGDNFYKSGKFGQAILRYTSSLRYAENGTENVKKAYFKRSACFYKLDDHTRGDIDVEYAIKAHKPREIPDHILQKRQTSIQYRKVECGEHSIKKIHLDFDTQENFPCLANVVDLKYNEQLGRHFVANCDIPQHKLILNEEYFAVCEEYDEKLCYTCLSAYGNFIPCENCTVAIFCNVECMYKNRTHHLECGSIFAFYGPYRPPEKFLCFRSKFTIQTVLNAIVTFPDVETLMDFVDRTLMEDPDRPPVSVKSDEEKYHAYFNLKKFQKEDFMLLAKCSYELAMQIQSIRELFDTVEKKRFLMHLVTHHVIVNSTNAFMDYTGLCINNMLSYFNHSCKPNTATCFRNISHNVVTKRDIKKDEQLCISYLGKHQLRLPFFIRRVILKTAWGFRCECIRCKNLFPALCF